MLFPHGFLPQLYPERLITRAMQRHTLSKNLSIFAERVNKCLSLEHALYLGRKWAGESALRNLIIRLDPRVARSANGRHIGGIQQPR